MLSYNTSIHGCKYLVLLHNCTHFRLLESLQTFLDKVELEQNGNSTTNSALTVFAFKSFALQVQQLDPKEYKGQMFSINLGLLEEAREDNQTIDQRALMTRQLESKQDKGDTKGVMNAMTTASLQLPEDLLDSCSDMNTNLTAIVPQRLSYSVFKSDILFQNLNQSHLSIGSIIVAARLKCANDLTLNTSIKSIFQINKTVRITIQADTKINFVHASFVDGRKFPKQCMCNMGQR